MRIYILKRMLYAIPTIIGITILIFGIMRILPGDPLGAYYGIETIIQWTPEQKAAILRDLGLDKPIAVQYALWMKDIASGKLGESFFRGDPIIDILIQRGPISAQIGLISVIISWIIGLPVGIISAVRPNSVWDMCTSFFTVLFLAIPGFWLGLLVVVACISWFQYKAPIVSVQFWEDPWTNFQIIVGPAIVLGLGQAAFIARMARSSLFEVLREDYVRTSRAKGLDRAIGDCAPCHAECSVACADIERRAAWLRDGRLRCGGAGVSPCPVLGKALVVAAIDRDFNVVQNIVLFYAVIFVLVNLFIDLLYGWLDPRIRLN